MFIIKGCYNNNFAYYRDSYIDNKSGYTMRIFSSTIKGATKYNSNNEAEKILKILNESNFSVYPVCPDCEKDYLGYPSISRKDNITKICPSCGIKEALYDFKKHYKFIK